MATLADTTVQATATVELPGKELPAVFINRFHVLVNPERTRVAFGEAVLGVEATYHSAIMLTTADALNLANLILELIEKNKKLVADAKSHANVPG